MYTLTLRLKTGRNGQNVLEKRFYAANHIHNVLVRHAGKLLTKLDHDAQYRALKGEYVKLLKKEELSGDDKVRKKNLSREMTEIVRSYGLSEYAFQSYIKLCGKRYNKCLSSQQIQKEATNVWRGVEKILYGGGRKLHFRKYRDAKTIGGKSSTNGAKFHADAHQVEWLGLTLDCGIPRDDPYVQEAFSGDLSYTVIKRAMFPNGWHYYATLVCKGAAPKKLNTNADVNNVTGIDIGTSTFASVSDDKAELRELAPAAKAYNSRIKALQSSMDKSKKLYNPNKYNPDGTYKKGNHDKWIYTRTYLKKRDRLSSLQRQKAAYIKQSHEAMINDLLMDSVSFVVEDMPFKSLQKRSKKTERQDKVSTITSKDGTEKQTRKYKRKKRFGRSLNNRAPAEFITILSRKAEQYGGGVVKVHTKAFRASQYDHVADTYQKTDLRQRSRSVGGHTVQRDLYSAFLLKNTDNSLDKPDRDKCIYEFKQFVTMQNALIADMKSRNISMRQCFGF
ncbi:MAG: hypothetical protein ACOX8B_05130 [Lachnospiraceae bacterium]|jgi:hypothetical protein